MNKEQQILPELRFPEFVNDGAWKIKRLSKLGTIINGLTYSPKDVQEDGLLVLRSSNVQDGQIVLNDCVFVRPDIKGANISSPNDILICVRNGSKSLIGKNAILTEGLPKSTHGAFMTMFRSNNPTFAFQLFQTESYQTQVKADLGATINSINTKNFIKYEFAVPSNLKEQQKIANCLSSLDEVIKTESEKLNLLQDHKKGLLQQLFPQQGKTQPQFRFPEFKNDGDWTLTTLNDVADYENGKAHEKEISKNGKYKVVNSKFISTEGEVVKFSDSANLETKIGDILMVLSDIPNGKALAKCFCVDKDDTYTVNQRICKITTTDINNVFLFYQLNRNKYFLRFDDGAKQTNLRKDDVLSCPILKPKNPKEQDKIANTLTSASILIEEQKLKIENLQNHKKGLLQQLFPNVNNVAV
ncbi:restriction endonuclease subunit S [Mariniflexile maritimum]|uniref:restriction endonuclease subunit S n=1 Tax=Mariniflexile maritimum TaxID=2682493 RepID=UPI0018DBE94B|nr:restriction endonuclease subunit S [Mariniflexile maritimum]